MSSAPLAPERICPAGQSLRTAPNPEAFYERLYAGDGSPVWDEGANGWLVFRFDQCAELQRDEKLLGNLYRNADNTIRAIKGGGANISLSQGREHELLRRFHHKLLSPSNVERYRVGHVAPIVAATLDRIAGQPRVDAITEIADRIPPRVICSLLGMPNTDDDAMNRLLRLNDELVEVIASGLTDPALRERALAASAELNEVLRPYVVNRRDNPADDFISRVWQEAPENGIDLDEEAALGLCRELYFAGSDTTVHGIANVLYALLANPELMAAIRADRDKAIAALVEESLRVFGVVQFRQRIALDDFTAGKAEIRKGQAVYLVNSAANLDPGQFECPARIDVTRRSPTNHLAFGRGGRSCVGSLLARAELREVIDQMLTRFPDMHLAPDAPTPVLSGTLFRRVRPLHIRLTR